MRSEGMMKENKYKYLAKNTILFTISSFGSKILSFLLVPFYTSVLSTSDYGVVDLIGTAANLLIFVVTICISDGVLRFAIESIDKRKGVFCYGLQIIVFGTGLTGVILFFLSLLNPFGWEKYYYLFLFLTIFTNSINQLISYYLQAIDKVTSVTIMGILLTISTIVSNLLLLLVYKFGVLGYLISAIVGSVMSSFFGMISILKNDRDVLRQKCDKQTKCAMVKYSIPLIFNGVAWWMNTSSDRFFIIFYCGYAVNGLYAVAAKIPTILTMFNSIFGQAWNLSAVKEFDPQDKNGFFKNIYEIYNFVLMGSCSLLILLNIPLAKIIFQKNFFVAWQYSSILVIASAFSALSGFFSSIFVAVKNTSLPALSTLFSAVLNIVLNWILTPKFGALGAAIATAISFFFVWLTRYVFSLKYIKMRVNLLRDFLVYGLICVQAIVAHINDHCYPIQVGIILAIILLYHRQVKSVLVYGIAILQKVGCTKK